MDWIACILSHVWLFVILWTVTCRLLCPWDFPGKDTGVGCRFLLQGIFCSPESSWQFNTPNKSSERSWLNHKPSEACQKMPDEFYEVLHSENHFQNRRTPTLSMAVFTLSAAKNDSGIVPRPLKQNTLTLSLWHYWKQGLEPVINEWGERNPEPCTWLSSAEEEGSDHRCWRPMWRPRVLATCVVRSITGRRLLGCWMPKGRLSSLLSDVLPIFLPSPFTSLAFF